VDLPLKGLVVGMGVSGTAWAVGLSANSVQAFVGVVMGAAVLAWMKVLRVSWGWITP